MMTILEAIDDPALFQSALKNPASWRGWRAFLAVLFGLPLDAYAVDLFRSCTGRETAPRGSFAESWLICGRRAGKSFTMALVVVFLACFRSYVEHLAPGERATIMIIAADRRQARTVLRYIQGLFELPLLRDLVQRETTEGFDLTNRVSIEVATASFRTVRGYTLAACVADEIAFWSVEGSTSPDTEILDALRPAMATIPGSMLICASSPYARRGAMWEAYRRYYGQDEAPVLVWKAPTRTMNSSFPQKVIDAAMERDPAHAAAEYGAEFRSDIETFVTREVVDAAVVPGRFEIPPIMGTSYRAFVDPSGGSADSMTMAVAHVEAETGILDCVREVRPPFDPDSVVKDFADLLQTYGIHKVEGDRYGGDWPASRFRAHGITYEPAPKAKSDIYKELLPLLNARRIELLDDQRLIAQLCGLERRTARGGRDSIDHASSAHDDRVNAAAGALVLAVGRSTGFDLATYMKAYG